MGICPVIIGCILLQCSRVFQAVKIGREKTAATGLPNTGNSHSDVSTNHSHTR